MLIAPVTLWPTRFSVAPSRALTKDKHDQGPQPQFAPPQEEKASWLAGEHLPPAYAGAEYLLADPETYDLPPAPIGYRYVRVRDHIYLAQIGTGYVRDVISAPLP